MSSLYEKLQLNELWVQTLNSIHSSSFENQGRPPIACSLGLKSANKSTFNRFVVNRLLSQYSAVAYLDCDPGQPEFGPPGVVALTVLQSPLLGPSWSHMKLAELSFFVGAVTPELDPTLYFSYLCQLWLYYQRAFACLPLVVNLHGWMKGIGLDLIMQTIQLIRPSAVIQFYSSELPESLDRHRFHGMSGQLRELTLLTREEILTSSNCNWWPLDQLHLKESCIRQLAGYHPTIVSLQSIQPRPPT